MRIAIVGTRGIPNHYGGFEQFAENLSIGLVQNGHQVIVYNSHNHPYKHSRWNGIDIIHKKDPEYKWGTFGQFVYDLNCIIDVRKRDCDIVLQLGYTSSSIWGWLLPKRAVIFTNMDGLEWKRSKFKKYARFFLKFAEKLAVHFSDHIICDSLGIKDYIDQKFGIDSTYIPYGATLFTGSDDRTLKEFSLMPYRYDMLIARLEPENNIEMILNGVVQAAGTRSFIVVGNHSTTYGNFLKEKYKSFKQIKFVGGIYDIRKLNNLRFFSNLYFHGHSVGGTNPSLLEAMASNCLISAHRNCFNKYILENDCFYFSNCDEVSIQLTSVDKASGQHNHFIKHNLQKIIELYSWEKIIADYQRLFSQYGGPDRIIESASPTRKSNIRVANDEKVFDPITTK